MRTMVVSASIGAADDHDRCIALEEAEVADGWFEEMAVLREPELAAA